MHFHLLLAQTTKNSIIVRMLEAISEPMDKAIRDIRKRSFNLEFSKSVLEEHRKIYQAIIDRNTLLAQKMMEEHLNHFEDKIRKFYKIKSN